MQRTLNLQVICDDDLLENRLTPPTFRAAVHFVPRLPVAQQKSVLATLAQAIHRMMVESIGPHSFTLVLSPEQQAEQELEQLALDATREPLVRLT